MNYRAKKQERQVADLLGALIKAAVAVDPPIPWICELYGDLKDWEDWVERVDD